MFRRILFTCLLVSTLLDKSNAQEGYLPYRTSCPNCRTVSDLGIAPYPTAAEYDSYNILKAPSSGSSSVDLYSGQVGVKLPLYTIPLRGGYSFPISLVYNASGIKVTQEASWVGLGWNLSFASPITRSIRGGDDFISSGGATDNPLVYLSGVHGRSYNGSASCNEACISNYNGQSIQSKFGAEKDLQTDVFTFSAGGYSTKFVLEPSRSSTRQVILLNQDKIRIKLVYTNNIKIPSIEVTTPDGARYFYGSEPGYTTSSSIYVAPTPYQSLTKADSKQTLKDGTIRNVSTTFVTSWYLRQFISPLNDTVSLTYNYAPGFNLISTTNKEHHVYLSANDLKDGIIGKKIISEDKIFENTPLPDKITFPLGSVSFTASTGRQDMVSSSTGYWLNNLVVRNMDGIVKNFKFEYDYFNSYLSLSASQKPDYYRLKLTSVKEMDIYGINSLPAHQMLYNESLNCGYVGGLVACLPSKKSLGQDHWGYFNNKNTGETILKPVAEQVDVLGTSMLFSGLDRDVSSQYAEIGILKRMNYPSGGYVEYSYSSNHYYSPNNTQKVVGGLRIERVKTSDGTLGNESYTLYKYNLTNANYDETSESSGVLLADVMYTRVPSGSAGWPMIRSSESCLPQSAHSESVVGYSQVQVYNGLNGEYGKTVHKFHGMPNYYWDAYLQEVALTPQNFGPATYYAFCYDNISTWNTTYVTQSNSNKNYLYVFNGLPKEKVDFSKKGNAFHKVSAETYSYTMGNNPATMSIQKVANAQLYGYVPYAYYVCYLCDGNDCTKGYQFANYYNCTLMAALGYYTPSVNLKLARVTAVAYEEGNSANYMGTITDYQYGNPLHLQLSQQCVTDLKDPSISTCKEFIYPADFSTTLFNDNTHLISIMAKDQLANSRHMHNKVIETLVKRKYGSEYKIISGEINMYAYANPSSSATSPIVLARTYKLETNVPLIQTAMAASANDPGYFASSLDKSYYVSTTGGYVGTFGYDNEYSSDPEFLFSQFDSRGNTIDATNKKSLFPNATIYGYKGNLAFASIQNATSSQVAYCGFEEGNKNENGWQGGHVVSSSPNIYIGTKAARIPFKASATVPANSIYKQLTPNPQSGKYKFSCYVKSATAIISAQLNLVCKLATDATNTPYPNVSLATVSVPITGTSGQWKYIEGEIDLTYLKSISDGSLLGIVATVANDDLTQDLYVDELRMYPSDAEMTSVSYEPLVGQLGIVDANNRFMRTGYDEFKRKKTVRDGEENILENNNYVVKP